MAEGGAVAALILPQPATQQAPQEESDMPNTWENFPAGLRVLVVDDDPLCLKVVEQMLKRCNYEVTTSTNGKSALQHLREKPMEFDLVLSDVYMPDMDGFKLLEMVGLELDLPVIMMSSNGETTTVLRGVTHGAVDFLIKPVRIEELRNLWQHVVRRKREQAKDVDSEEHSQEKDEPPDTSRKRKDAGGAPGDFLDRPAQEDDGNASKKARVVWSVEMHQQFVNAVNQLGIDKAVPKKILEIMNVDGLTRENVASHLQKYRLYLKRVAGVQTTAPRAKPPAAPPAPAPPAPAAAPGTSAPAQTNDPIQAAAAAAAAAAASAFPNSAMMGNPMAMMNPAGLPLLGAMGGMNALGMNPLGMQAPLGMLPGMPGPSGQPGMPLPMGLPGMGSQMPGLPGMPMMPPMNFMQGMGMGQLGMPNMAMANGMLPPSMMPGANNDILRNMQNNLMQQQGKPSSTAQQQPSQHAQVQQAQQQPQPLQPIASNPSAAMPAVGNAAGTSALAAAAGTSALPGSNDALPMIDSTIANQLADELAMLNDPSFAADIPGSSEHHDDAAALFSIDPSEAVTAFNDLYNTSAGMGVEFLAQGDMKQDGMDDFLQYIFKN